MDELRVHLAPLSQRFDFGVWSDMNIAGGDSWEAEIDAAIRKASIALVLVSADYLASKWISNRELPRLLERVEKDEIRIIPVILRPSAWAHTPLAYFQAFPRDGKPLSTLSLAERDRAWVELYKVLEAELHRLSKDQDPLRRPAGQGSDRDAVGPALTSKDRREHGERHKPKAFTPVDGAEAKFFISHAKEDGDFAENLKGRMKEIGLIGWIDTDVLEAGVDWRTEIDEAILDSHALILILSPDSKSSEYVTYEWAFALGSGLRIVPLMLRDTSIHPRLEVFQYLDFTNRRARPWDRLFGLLRDVSPPTGHSEAQSKEDAPE